MPRSAAKAWFQKLADFVFGTIVFPLTMVSVTITTVTITTITIIIAMMYYDCRLCFVISGLCAISILNWSILPLLTSTYHHYSIMFG